MTQRGVSVAQAGRDLDLHATVLSRLIRELCDSPPGAFPGKGQLEDEEVRRLRREVAKLKAERDILKKPRPTSPGTSSSVRVHSEASGNLAGQLDV